MHATALALALSALALLGACARVAPVAGYEFGVPLTVDRSAGLVNTYDNEGTGTSANHTLRVGAALESDSLLPSGLLLSPRLLLAISNGRFEADSFRFDDPTAPVPVSTRSYDVYSTVTVLGLDAPLLVDLGDFFVGAGPWASYRLSSGVIQTEHIITPASFTYPDGERSRTTRTGEELASPALRLGALLSVGTTIAATPTLALRPELHGRVDFMSLAADLGARSLSVGATLSLIPTSEPDRTPLAAVAAETDIATPRAPSATIDLRLVSDGPLLGSGTLERLELPLRPVVAFATGSTAIASSTTPTSAARLGIDSLARLSPWELQSRALDIVGMRMREHPATSLALRGGREAAEDRALAAARARAVREYFVRVWGIDSSRVRILREQTSAAETRIELDAPLAMPIVTRWVTRSYSAPRVALRHAIDAPMGVRYWEIALRQGDRVVARATEESGDSVLAADVTLAGGLLPVVAELTVIDSLGARAIARDTLALREHAVQGAIAAERRVLVVAADEDLAERARALAAATRDGASVVIGRLGSANERGPSPVRMASLLLAELERRGIRLGALRVADSAEEPAPRALAGALRVVIEQGYVDKPD